MKVVSYGINEKYGVDDGNQMTSWTTGGLSDCFLMHPHRSLCLKMSAPVTEMNPQAFLWVRICQKSKNMAVGVLQQGSDGDQGDNCAWLITKMEQGWAEFLS